MLLTCILKDLEQHRQPGDSCLVTSFPSPPHSVTERAPDLPLLGQHQHSSVSFPSGATRSTDSGNFAQTNRGYGFHVTLWYDVPAAAALPGSGRVALPRSLPFPGPCTSLAALASDLAAVQLLRSWMSKLLGQESFLFLVDLFSVGSDR